MKSLRKNEQLNIRFNREQIGQLRRAAEIESRRRKAIVEPSTLLRELGMAAVERLLADASPQAAAS